MVTRPARDADPGAEAGDGTRKRDRGQTQIDFAVGAGLFLLSVAFVFAFVPGMLGPFTGGQSDIVAADRAAQQLGNGVLSESARPYVLDRDCTVAFFDGEAPAECAFETTDLHAALSLDETNRLNVTITNEGSVATLDGVTLRAGEPVPARESTVSARRVVFVGGETYRLTVTVW